MSKNRFTVIALLIILCGVSAGTIGYFCAEFFHNRSEMQNLQEIAYESIESSQELDSGYDYTTTLTEYYGKGETSQKNAKKTSVVIPVDIKALQVTNPDIFAWIQIPDTVINYPVAQHPTNDEYYLKHGPDGRTSSYGCPFVELCDQLPFLEFNTVIYGHNMNDGSMFAGLHKYEDKDFFDKHRTIFIYTADHIYTYKVYAAVMYSDNRIPYYFDDTIESDRTAFLESLKTDIVKERSYISNDLTVNKANNIITLSTCDKKLRDKRFLVVAKLTQIDGQDVK